MKQIKMAHLYPDILNLYGDNGNMKALELEMENAGLKVNVDEITLGDRFDPKSYDLVYIGPGSDNGQKMVIPHLTKHRKAVQNSIENGRIWLATGNALNLFGTSITYDDDETVDALGVFDHAARPLGKRTAEECVMEAEDIYRPIIGIEIRTTVMEASPYPLFKVIRGTGSSPGDKVEGVRYKGFYGTYVTGPILPRNPDLLRHMIERVVSAKDPGYELKMPDMKENDEAYEAFMDRVYKELK